MKTGVSNATRVALATISATASTSMPPALARPGMSAISCAVGVSSETCTLSRPSSGTGVATAFGGNVATANEVVIETLSPGIVAAPCPCVGTPALPAAVALIALTKPPLSIGGFEGAAARKRAKKESAQSESGPSTIA